MQSIAVAHPSLEDEAHHQGRSMEKAVSPTRRRPLAYII
jgi:hypothetical protein